RNRSSFGRTRQGPVAMAAAGLFASAQQNLRQQRDRAGQRLHEQDFARDRKGAEQAGRDHAQQEERPHGKAAVAEPDSPDEVGGGAARADAMAGLAGMHHRQATAPEIGDWIAAAEAETLNQDQVAAVREFKRQYVNMTCLPTEFVERQTRARMQSEQLWRDLRPKSDWAGFQPALEGVVTLVREEAALRAG